MNLYNSYYYYETYEQKREYRKMILEQNEKTRKHNRFSKGWDNEEII